MSIQAESSVELESFRAAEVKIEGFVKILQDELPGVTFGYIGNFERWGDERCFYIFLPTPDRAGTYEDSVSLGAFRQLPAAVERLEQLAETARRRYHNGSRRA